MAAREIDFEFISGRAGLAVAVGAIPAPLCINFFLALGESMWIDPAPSDPHPLQTAASASKLAINKDWSRNLECRAGLMS
jgi:hypothetical protein